MAIYKLTFVLFIYLLFSSPQGQASANPLEARPDSRLSGPVITNSNENASAYFQLRKTDGTNEIVKVPPQSKMQLGPEVAEFQYLYTEGKGTVPSLPDITTMTLTNPDSDVADELELPPTPFSAPPESMPEDSQEKETILPERPVADATSGERLSAIREQEQEKALEQFVPPVSAIITNHDRKTLVVSAILANNLQYILILDSGQTLDLPHGTQWVELRPDKTGRFGRKEQALATVKKADGTILHMTDAETKVSLL